MKSLVIQLIPLLLVPSCAYRAGSTPEGGKYAEITLGTDEQEAWTTPHGAGRLAQNQSTSVKYGAQAIVAGVSIAELGSAAKTFSGARTAQRASRDATTLGVVRAKEATRQARDALKAGVETTKILNP